MIKQSINIQAVCHLLFRKVESSAEVTPSNVKAYQVASYTFKITPDHDLPARGYIVITYPEEISIGDASFSQSQCGSFLLF